MDETNFEIGRVKIDEPYYDQLLQMITSEDDANKEIAYQVIEQMDYEDNFVYILFLYRSCNNTARNKWQELAPNSARFCEALKTNHSFTVIGLYNSLKGHVTPEQEDFVARQFGNSLKNQLQNYGYGFIEDIKFKIKW